jgi:post-segregation antitoxin (ccd killing protein)
MEPTINISKEIRESATNEWRSSVIEHLNQKPNLSYFEAAEDSPSIISVRIKHPVTNRWMVKSELVNIFKDQTLDVSSQYPKE